MQTVLSIVVLAAGADSVCAEELVEEVYDFPDKAEEAGFVAHMGTFVCDISATNI